jgi:hypothetical protein
MPTTYRTPQHDVKHTNTTHGDPLHQASQTPTTIVEKKPCLLWEEQTRDAPTKVKKTASTNQAPELVPDASTTNIERHLIAHTTQGQTPSKLSNTRSRRSDFPLLRRALRDQPGPPPSRATTLTYHRSLLSCNATQTVNPRWGRLWDAPLPRRRGWDVDQVIETLFYNWRSYWVLSYFSIC